MNNPIPRRINVSRWTPAEHAISAAMRAVEEMGADPALTDAVVLLEQAKSRVADYVDACIAEEASDAK